MFMSEEGQEIISQLQEICAELREANHLLAGLVDHLVSIASAQRETIEKLEALVNQP